MAPEVLLARISDLEKIRKRGRSVSKFEIGLFHIHFAAFELSGGKITFSKNCVSESKSMNINE